MGMTRVRVSGAAPTAYGAGKQYTAPASTKSTLKEVTVNNTTNASAVFSMAINAYAAGTEVYTQYPIGACTSLTFWHQVPLCATEWLCICSPGTVNFVFGIEENTV